MSTPTHPLDGERPVTALLSEHSVTSLDVVHHADALAWLRALPDEWADMMLTSPPYDNLRAYKGYSFPFEVIAHEAYRVLKPGGVLVWVVGDATINGSETLTSFRQALYFVGSVGFKMHDTMIYEKNASSPNIHHPRYMQVFEYMFVLLKGDKPRVWNPQMRPNKLAGLSRGGPSQKMQRNGEKGRWGASDTYAAESLMGNIWTFNTGAASRDDPEAFEHPAPFPEALAERHILTWSNPGELVVDFFMGSGTTAKVARSIGRRYAGCDISREYVDIARQRLSSAYTLPLFDRVEVA